MIGMDELTLRHLKLALEYADKKGEVLFPEARSAERLKQSTVNPVFSALWVELHERAERYAASTPEMLPFSRYMNLKLSLNGFKRLTVWNVSLIEFCLRQKIWLRSWISL